MLLISTQSTASIADIREVVTTLEETEAIARRVLGGAHPTTTGIDTCLRTSRVALRACEEYEKKRHRGVR